MPPRYDDFMKQRAATCLAQAASIRICRGPLDEGEKPRENAGRHCLSVTPLTRIVCIITPITDSEG